MAEKMGEALNRRAELQRRIGELRGRVIANATSQEGEEPAEDPNELLNQLREDTGELGTLVARINTTNASSQLTTPEGDVTLTQALALRSSLDDLSAALRGAADSASGGGGFRYMRSELRIARNVDPGALRREADDVSARRRALDTAIQEHNWTTELVE